MHCFLKENNEESKILYFSKTVKVLSNLIFLYFIQKVNQFHWLLFLLGKVHKEKTIKITAVLGDEEAFQFASEIKDYLELQGWRIEGVDRADYNHPIIGQIVIPQDDGGIEIIIGAKE